MVGRKWFWILAVTGSVFIVANLLAVNGFAQTWSSQRPSPNSEIVSEAPKGEIKGGGGLNVLFVVADIPAAYSAIRNGLTALPEVGGADTFNSDQGTPTLEQLSNYSCVIVWAAFFHQNPVVLGNNLADYVDNGGAVIASTPSRTGPFSIGGRFLSGGYDPLFNGTGPMGPAILGNWEDHPTMNTPYTIRNLSGDARERAPVRADADLIAHWNDAGFPPLLAIKGAVAGDSAFLHNTFWSGQFPQLLANLCVYLTGKSGDSE